MTLMQAFKVWWSYSWRASILVIPLAIIMTAWSLAGLIATLENMMQSGQSLQSLGTMNMEKLLGLVSGGTTLFILSMVLTAVIQVFAMRWTLNSRWSDFRLKAVPPDAEVGSQPGRRDSGKPASV
ncbi:MAG: hypothetical protein ACREV7_14500 [Steroidobacteraceae bacterium]